MLDDVAPMTRLLRRERPGVMPGQGAPGVPRRWHHQRHHPRHHQASPWPRPRSRRWRGHPSVWTCAPHLRSAHRHRRDAPLLCNNAPMREDQPHRDPARDGGAFLCDRPSLAPGRRCARTGHVSCRDILRSEHPKCYLGVTCGTREHHEMSQGDTDVLVSFASSFARCTLWD